MACIIVLVLSLLFALSCSPRVSSVTTRDILDHALLVEGPDHIEVLNVVKENGAWIRVDGRVELDMGKVLAFSG